MDNKCQCEFDYSEVYRHYCPHVGRNMTERQHRQCRDEPGMYEAFAKLTEIEARRRRGKAPEEPVTEDSPGNRKPKPLPPRPPSACQLRRCRRGQG